MLEGRQLLATFTVANLFDGGPDSLRAAVAAANANPGADAIGFATSGTITLTSGQLDITDSVSISGPGVNALTVSGNDASRIFMLAVDSTVSISDLTVANGRTFGSPGGGISVSGGSLTLTRVNVSDNEAFGATGGEGGGGGIYIAGGTVTLEQCLVSGNVALGGSGAGGYAVLYGGAGGEGTGGGIFVGGGMLHLNQSTIFSNSAIGGQGGDSDEQYWAGWENTYGGNGGSAAGGGVRVTGGTVEFNLSFISGNTAAGGLGGAGTFNGWAGMGEGGGLNTAPIDPPITYLDTYTVSNTTDNFAEVDPNIAGPYTVAGTPRLTVGDVKVTEGNAGTRTAAFTVSLSATSTQAVSVAYATSNGTASAGSDYQAKSGILTIPAGQTSSIISVNITGDRLAELDEAFFIDLTNATNATIADRQGMATIVDDEPKISISDVSKAEGRKGQTTLFTFTVSLSAAYDQPVTMSYRTANGTATTSNSDYVAKTGTLTFAAGETSKTITIEVKGDSKREASETFYVDLFGNSGNSKLKKSRGLATILNDD